MRRFLGGLRGVLGNERAIMNAEVLMNERRREAHIVDVLASRITPAAKTTSTAAA